MPILTFDGLLFSPLLLFVAIVIVLTVLTNLITPKVISKYTNHKAFLAKLSPISLLPWVSYVYT